MEVKLDNLIEKIKQDGVGEAKKEAELLINTAYKQAQTIVDEAKKQAEEIIKQGRNDLKQREINSRDALRQAGRDTILAVRQQLKKVFAKLLKRRVDEALSVDFLKKLISKVIERWLPSDNASFEVLISQEDKNNLTERLLGELKNAAASSIVIKVSNNISKGFRIGIKGEDAYYDLSDESIIEALNETTSPIITELFKKQDG